MRQGGAVGDCRSQACPTPAAVAKLHPLADQAGGGRSEDGVDRPEASDSSTSHKGSEVIPCKRVDRPRATSPKVPSCSEEGKGPEATSSAQGSEEQEREAAEHMPRMHIQAIGVCAAMERTELRQEAELPGSVLQKMPGHVGDGGERKGIHCRGKRREEPLQKQFKVIMEEQMEETGGLRREASPKQLKLGVPKQGRKPGADPGASSASSHWCPERLGTTMQKVQNATEGDRRQAPHDNGLQGMAVPVMRPRASRGVARPRGSWASASDSEQPLAAHNPAGGRQKAGRMDVRRHPPQADCKEGRRIIAAKSADDLGSRTGALGSPSVAKKIEAAQLPRPPEQPPVLAAACSQGNGAGSGCQAKKIATDTLPRPPESAKVIALDRMMAAVTVAPEGETHTMDALAKIVSVFGNKAADELPPGLLESWVELTGRGWGDMLDEKLGLGQA